MNIIIINNIIILVKKNKNNKKLLTIKNIDKIIIAKIQITKILNTINFIKKYN